MNRLVGACGLPALVVAAVVGIAVERELSLGRDEAAAASAAAASGDFPAAIAHARAAAEAWVPGSDWSSQGQRRLEAIGREAEARGDQPTALLAYGAMLTAASRSRSPWHASSDWRSTAEAGLMRIEGARPDGPGPRLTAARGASFAEERPTPWTLAALAAGAWAMIGGLAWLGWGSRSGRSLRLAQTAAVVGFAICTVVLLAN